VIGSEALFISSFCLPCSGVNRRAERDTESLRKSAVN
jgi:hypothetical protein